MKCPFCNADMKEEQVFCEACGKEIHLVPLFDPTVETTMEQSLSGIASHVNLDNETEESDDNIEDDVVLEEGNKISQGFFAKKNIRSLFLAAIIAIVSLVLVIVLIIQIPNMYSAESYYTKANEAYQLQNYGKAQSYALKALDKQLPKDYQYDMSYMLANIYKNDQIYDQACTYYLDCISIKPEETAAYQELIALYERTESYSQIAKLLSECQNRQITTEYSEYLASIPTFDMEPGKYTEVVYLKMLSDGEGEIHYTINGERPTKESDTYVLPIKLENGTFHIEAMFINQYGVESETIAGDYEIEVMTPDGPEVSLDPGVYHEPQTIDVFMPDETYSVYYTIDGEAPDLSSNKYESTLLLALGKHTYQFIMYDSDGVASDIEEREYQLSLDDAVFDVESARFILLQNLIMRGILLDAEGHSVNGGEVKQYSCNSAFMQEGQSFYLFIESNQNNGGGIPSGTMYAVGVQTGDVYKAVCDDSGLFFTEGM